MTCPPRDTSVERKKKRIMNMNQWLRGQRAPTEENAAGRGPTRGPTLVDRALGLSTVDKVEADVHVQSFITHVFSYFCGHDPALCLAPAEDFSKEAECVGLDTCA